jgi:predicted carbohydrate-binding protein with CBM5 and CBM33 domain
MKTLRKIIIISVGAMLLTTYSFTNTKQSGAVETVNETCYSCQYDQCHATAASTGQRCKHCVSNSGDLYCWQH